MALPILIATHASAQLAEPLDVNETDRVRAQLDDVRAISLVLVIVIVALLDVVLWIIRALISNLIKSVEGLTHSVER